MSETADRDDNIQSTSASTLTLTCYAGGRLLSRSDVLGWERQRTAAAIMKYINYLSTNIPDAVTTAATDHRTESVDLDSMRLTLAALKAHLTHDQVVEMFSRQLAISRSISRAGIALCGGRRSLSSVEIAADMGTAQGFVDWFLARHDADDESAMLAANPDHHMVTRLPDGRQDVIETTGGAPLPSHFIITFGDIDGLTIARDDRYPVHFGGRCHLPDGTEIGAALHQFRDEKSGFSAKLGIEFPAVLPRRLVMAHYWHLACEFSNWIEAYFKSQYTLDQQITQP